jgi:hypothetical protein
MLRIKKKRRSGIFDGCGLPILFYSNKKFPALYNALSPQFRRLNFRVYNLFIIERFNHKKLLFCTEELCTMRYIVFQNELRYTDSINSLAFDES